MVAGIYSGVLGIESLPSVVAVAADGDDGHAQR